MNSYGRTGLHGLMLAFCVFCLHCEFNDAHIDAAASRVLFLYLLFQMIANPRKTRNLHLIDTRNQNQSYSI